MKSGRWNNKAMRKPTSGDCSESMDVVDECRRLLAATNALHRRNSRHVELDELSKYVASGSAVRARSRTSSSAAASAWRGIWPTFRSFAVHRRRTAQTIEKSPARADPTKSPRRTRRSAVCRRGDAGNRRSAVSRRTASDQPRTCRRPKARAAVVIDHARKVQPDDQRGRSSADAGDAERAEPAKRLGADQPASTT